ncbi:MAG: serine/threonine-protein kinase [Gammaproteobacteria bacterium]|nr:serine/threonine-protein kinase [Gammaproteobacteria bacterium]
MISPRAAEIFHKAGTLDPQAREQYVDASCKGDAVLLREVRTLLTAANESESYFENLAGKINLGALAEDDQPLPRNKTIGPWRLLRRIGRGGMGVVYLAERADEQYEQQVALKVLPAGLDSEQAHARFLTERQILAGLAHDNIARLLDGGVTEDGAPYFAMDYVEGLPIDEYCEQQNLGLEERLYLILDVARAVQFAHRNLVIHRDLKPNNVLVASGGKVRLLDFGIAKMLEPDPAGMKLTQVAQRPVTPIFASPEMLRGEPVNVTADVYSIGVLMYALLTGQVPLSYEGLSLTEMCDHATNTDPPPASRFNSRLRGDIDAIIAKALAKFPGERYQSAESLANDIRNKLNGLPVEAKAPSAIYRVRKFLGRHRLGAAFATFAVIALVTIAALAVQSAVTAERQAQQILLESDRAERISDFITSIFRDADPYWNNDLAPLSATDLLHQSEERLNTRDLMEPAARFELLVTLGQSYTGLQDNASAIRVLENALSIAAEHDITDLSVLADAQFWLSQAYGYLGRDDEALAILNVATDTVAKLDEAGEHLRGQIPLQRAALLLHKGQFDEALTVLLAEVRQLEEAGKADGIDMAMAQQMLAVTYRRIDRGAEALDAARTAHNLFLEFYAAEPQHPRIVDATMTYGRALVQVGDYRQGAEMIEEAARLTIMRFGDSSMIAGHFLTSLAAVQTERGDLVNAVQNARHGLEIFLEQKQTGTLEHASRLSTIGGALLAQRDVASAKHYLAEANAITKKEDFAMGRVRSSVSLALIDTYSGEFAHAEQLLQELVRETQGSDDRSRYQALRNLGTAYRLQGRSEDALSVLELSIAENKVPARIGDRASSMVETALVYLAQQNAAEAQAQLDSAESIFMALLVADTPPVADLMVARGRIALLNSDPSSALAYLESANAFWTELNPESRWAGVAAFWLARCYRALGRTRDAAEAHARAMRILSASPIPIDVQLLAMTT